MERLDAMEKIPSDLSFVTCFRNKCRRMRINYITNHQTIYKNLEKNKVFLKGELRPFLLQHTFDSVEYYISCEFG
jgi:hypothetical protein